METVHDLPDGDWRRVQKADGYRFIIVNGQVTFEDNVCSGALPGKMLRSYDQAPRSVLSIRYRVQEAVVIRVAPSAGSLASSAASDGGFVRRAITMRID